jgi:hypothetical protein
MEEDQDPESGDKHPGSATLSVAKRSEEVAK